MTPIMPATTGTITGDVKRGIGGTGTTGMTGTTGSRRTDEGIWMPPEHLTATDNISTRNRRISPVPCFPPSTLRTGTRSRLTLHGNFKKATTLQKGAATMSSTVVIPNNSNRSNNECAMVYSCRDCRRLACRADNERRGIRPRR